MVVDTEQDNNETGLRNIPHMTVADDVMDALPTCDTEREFFSYCLDSTSPFSAIPFIIYRSNIPQAKASLELSEIIRTALRHSVCILPLEEVYLTCKTEDKSTSEALAEAVEIMRRRCGPIDPSEDGHDYVEPPFTMPSQEVLDALPTVNTMQELEDTRRDRMCRVGQVFVMAHGDEPRAKTTVQLAKNMMDQNYREIPAPEKPAVDS